MGEIKELASMVPIASENLSKNFKQSVYLHVHSHSLEIEEHQPNGEVRFTHLPLTTIVSISLKQGVLVIKTKSQRMFEIPGLNTGFIYRFLKLIKNLGDFSECPPDEGNEICLCAACRLS